MESTALCVRERCTLGLSSLVPVSSVSLWLRPSVAVKTGGHSNVMLSVRCACVLPVRCACVLPVSCVFQRSVQLYRAEWLSEDFSGQREPLVL